MVKRFGLLAAGALVASVGWGSAALAADSKAALYGDLRFGLDYSDSQGPVTTASGAEEDTDFRELNSFAGVKGSTTQDRLTAFGAYEFYLDGVLGPVLLGATTNLMATRQAYVGVACEGLGTLSFGRMFTDYARSGLALDPFVNTSLANPFGGTPDAASLGILASGAPYVSYGLSPLLTGEIGVATLGAIQGNQLAYASPSFGGVSFNAGVFIDENDDGTTGGGTDEESHDYAGGLSFNLAGISAGVQHLQMNDEVGGGTFIGAGGTGAGGTGDASATRLHAGFNQKAFGVNLSHELVDLQGVGANDEQYYYLSSWFGLGAATRLAASVGMTNETAFEGSGVQVGVFHDVIEGLTMHAGGSMYDLEDNSVSGPAAVDDTYTIALGASYKFQLGTGK